MRSAAPALVVLAAASAGCGATSNGTAAIVGAFFVRACDPSGDRPLRDYFLDASFQTTLRQDSNLEIALLGSAVDLEETDGMLILIDDVRTLRADSTRPLVRPLVRSGSVAAALNLYQTCPDRPNLHAVAGEVAFTRFDIAEDPDDTGSQEVISGTLTATVVSADPGEIVGWVRAEFDFFPPNQPLLRPR